MTRAGKERGYVLIITLLVTTLLVAVIVEFAYNVYVSTARAANFSQSQRAALLAANGVELGAEALKLLIAQDPYLITKDGLTFTKTEGDMSVTVRAVDERSKLSTAVVYRDTGVTNDKIHKSYSALLKLLTLEPNLTDTLADWIDSDSEPRRYGAEGRDFYRGLRSPYDPRNSYLGSLEELLMIKDYDKSVLDALSPYVTVHNNDGLVNINTAPAKVIMALSENITAELAEELLRYRKEFGIKKRADIMKVPGFKTIGFELQDRVVTTSRLFRIYSKARAADSEREIEAVVNVGKSILYWRER